MNTSATADRLDVSGTALPTVPSTTRLTTEQRRKTGPSLLHGSDRPLARLSLRPRHDPTRRGRAKRRERLADLRFVVSAHHHPPITQARIVVLASATDEGLRANPAPHVHCCSSASRALSSSTKERCGSTPSADRDATSSSRILWRWRASA